MSMISSQCDRLRDRATRVEIFLEGCTDTIPMDTHEQLRNAANTIWELRNKLADMVDQREEIEWLKAENAELRAERDEWHRVAVSKQDIIDHMRDAREENAELRELVRKWYPHMLKRVGRDALEQWGQMEVVRELGIEVDA